jgi:hypothetical protein
MFNGVLGRSEPRSAGWRVDEADYQVLIGRSSADIASTCNIKVVQPADS